MDATAYDYLSDRMSHHSGPQIDDGGYTIDFEYASHLTACWRPASVPGGES
jgi:hypothetical protein